MTGPDGFHREPLNPCEPIQAAQARRMVHQLRMTRAEIIAVGDAGHYSADAYIYAGHACKRHTPPDDRGSQKRGLRDDRNI